MNPQDEQREKAWRDRRADETQAMRRATTLCYWCNRPTAMTHTQRCDACWELEGRIRSNLELAERILKAYSQKEIKP